ncbi:high-potential iron-sulfur protein [Burkholderia multivorans]|uniref:high-potential iron-sulfur protein n=1 Tax=Burkholderia multivorans TaxID=87883 RepID=UPI000D004660|nr:high-potential iron-sulfur protein [Burkholderia multivorans]AYY57591.1 High potential iron-sulfur protein [Burkholderia multivorans]MBR8338489.1 high-potential iron-sulfur protein [Burkholderia multivorans]MBU9326297.1 high-potential iron-sulfur protein [Burkholderia multivorans]MBU9459187.1 high-potential iron-sulfur protein [Burkholderia multivorans]MBU9522726.1 high-potential iron-sulfur protein [Burkholderia multivorans]
MTYSTTRRTFIVQTLGLCAALAAARTATAAPPLVDENDATAKSLGYRAHAAAVDTAQFPKYQPGQRCANCRFYKGEAADAAGTCPMFGGKAVAADGWCNVYAKRA